MMYAGKGMKKAGGYGREGMMVGRTIMVSSLALFRDSGSAGLLG